MVFLHRVLILLAIASGLGAIAAKFWARSLWVIGTPSAWLRATEALLLLAIALMLEQILTTIRAKKAAERSATSQAP